MAILRGLIGIAVLLAIAYLLSSKRTAVRWKTVFIGLALQFTLAFGVLRIEWVKQVFNVMGGFFTAILEFTESGSLFLFGNLIDASNPAIGYVFALQILPTIVFFSALTSILYYFGIIQRVVKALAWLLTKALGISGAESLSVAGNIFLGQTEAPLLIKAYLPKMNRSEILLVMTGGMATVAGGVLASYVSF
jgi:Nucleoside permease